MLHQPIGALAGPGTLGLALHSNHSYGYMQVNQVRGDEPIHNHLTHNRRLAGWLTNRQGDGYGKLNTHRRAPADKEDCVPGDDVRSQPRIRPASREPPRPGEIALFFFIFSRCVTPGRAELGPAAGL